METVGTTVLYKAITVCEPLQGRQQKALSTDGIWKSETVFKVQHGVWDPL